MSLMIKDLRKTPNNTNKNFNEKAEEMKMNKYALYTVVRDNGQINEDHYVGAAEYPQRFYDDEDNALRALMRCAQDEPKVEFTEFEKQFITCKPEHYGPFFKVEVKELGISEKLIDLLQKGEKIKWVYTMWYNNGDINEYEEEEPYDFFFATEEEAKEFYNNHPEEFGWNTLRDLNKPSEEEEAYSPYCYITRDVVDFDLVYDINMCEVKKTHK